ncbi:MAG: AtpZ/AtpI family protein [Actinomycetota bacterium]|nr:AtpZ/AtpI family protein [Actinomycetota bacterium]
MDRDGSDTAHEPGPPDPWAALSYILSGVLFWGGAGWLVDRWLGTTFVVAIGLIVGAAAGVYLVYLRYGQS